MKTLHQRILEALEESKDCIQITYLSKSNEPEIEEDREARADKIKDVVMAHIADYEMPGNPLSDATERYGFRRGMEVYRRELLESME